MSGDESASSRVRTRNLPFSLFEAFQLFNDEDRELRASFPQASFNKKVIDDFKREFPQAELPDGNLLERLYERASTAALDLKIGLACEQKLSSPEWKRHRSWTKRVLKQIQELTKTLQQMGPVRVPPSLRSQIEKTLQRLRILHAYISTMQKRDEVVKYMASTHLKNFALRIARGSLDRVLRTHAQSLRADQRLQLVSSSLIAIGLKEAARENVGDIEATSRALRRQRRRKRERSRVRTGSDPNTGK